MECKTRYQCSQCDEIHEDEDDARECCQPEVWEVYECGECGKLHGSDEVAAKSCCEQLVKCPACSRDYGQYNIASHSIEVAGHCPACATLCSPLMSSSRSKICTTSEPVQTPAFCKGAGDAPSNHQ